MTPLQYEKYNGCLNLEKQLIELNKYILQMQMQPGCKEQNYLLHLTNPLREALLKVISTFKDLVEEEKESI